MGSSWKEFLSSPDGRSDFVKVVEEGIDLEGEYLVIKAAFEMPAPPCDKYSCPARAECSEYALACSAYAEYLRGKDVMPAPHARFPITTLREEKAARVEYVKKN